MIEADVVTGLTKVVPGPTYVLRLSEAEEIQKYIDEQIEAIKKEEAAYNKGLKEGQTGGLLGFDNPALITHSEESYPHNTGAIVATIIGCVLLVAFSILFFIRRRRLRKY